MTVRTRPPLRVAVLLDSLLQPRWRYQVLEDIRASDCATIVLLVRNAGKPVAAAGRLRRALNGRAHLLHTLYDRLDRRLFRGGRDPFEPADISALDLDCPILDVTCRRTRFSDYLSDEDVSRMRKERLDVVLRFGFRILRGPVLASARYGVWSYHHGDNRRYRGSPPGFWEVMEGNPVTGSVLQRLTDRLDGGDVLYRSFGATDLDSVSRNRNGLYWKSRHFVIRKLRELHGEGRLITEKSPGAYSGPIYRLPSNARMARDALRMAGRYAMRRLTTGADRWELHYHIEREPTGELPPLYRFKPLTPPRDRFWADPFPIVRDDRYFIFLEEYVFNRKKAHISVIEMDRRGNHSAPVKVLEREHHLSYPFVFDWQGRLFMIPESGAGRRVELYECVEFPRRWELRKTLLEGLRAVDATLHEQDGTWWMFVNIAQPGASSRDELHLFHADAPIGPWTAHPANPVKSDVRSARPAGRLFRQDGRLYRPAQDSSRRYGYAIALNEIVRLDPERFEERQAARILPDWRPGIQGTHTLNRCEGLTVVDAVRGYRSIFRSD